MIQLAIVGVLVFAVALTMTMVGKGGGNFYVVILALAGVPMHEAATTGQFMLFSASVAAMIIFHRNRFLSWSLAVIVGTLTALSALAGGYCSHGFSGFSLKILFAVMLIVAGGVMLVRVRERPVGAGPRPWGVLPVRSGEATYRVNLWVAVPVTVLTGLASGMVGVSGGSFLVPLMVLACGVPMHMAVGTASMLIATSSFMGFAGHALQGDFNPAWAVPLAVVAIAGGLLGGRFALKTRPKHLKQLFAYTNWLAAGFMLMNAIFS